MSTLFIISTKNKSSLSGSNGATLNLVSLPSKQAYASQITAQTLTYASLLSKKRREIIQWHFNTDDPPDESHCRHSSFDLTSTMNSKNRYFHR